jgi:hypothetical protein
MPYNDLRAEHPVRYDKPGSPYLAIDAVMDGWPAWTPPAVRPVRTRDCHLCGAKRVSGGGATCERCLDKLRARASLEWDLFGEREQPKRGRKGARSNKENDHR